MFRPLILLLVLFALPLVGFAIMDWTIPLYLTTAVLCVLIFGLFKNW